MATGAIVPNAVVDVTPVCVGPPAHDRGRLVTNTELFANGLERFRGGPVCAPAGRLASLCSDAVASARPGFRTAASPSSAVSHRNAAACTSHPFPGHERGKPGQLLVSKDEKMRQPRMP